MDKKQKAILGLKQSIANRRRDMVSLECQGNAKQFKNAQKDYSRLVLELKEMTKAKAILLAQKDFLLDYTGPTLFSM